MEHRLLFLRINNIFDRWVPKKKETWRIFEYEHVGRNWAADDHEFSPDKAEYINCYDDLQKDHYYLLLTTKVPGKVDQLGSETYHRWVWSGCIELTEAQIRKVYQFFKKHNNDMKETIKFAEELIRPTINIDRIEEHFGMTF